MARKRRTWTTERLLKAIRDLDHRGIALNYASVLKVDHGLPQAARKLLGSWNDALRAAGYDPDKIRLIRRPWTRAQIIELIQRRATAGLPIASYNVVPMSAEVASRRLFGSWKAALRAAGIPRPTKKWPIWTKVSVVEAILFRQQAGEPLYCYAVARQASRLYDAARWHFGKWDEALRAAGFDPATVRRRCPTWTPDAVIDELRRRAGTGMLTAKPALDPVSLARASRRFFGSWRAALEFAGVAVSDSRRLDAAAWSPASSSKPNRLRVTCLSSPCLAQ